MATGKSLKQKIKDGVFVEVKRLARVDLSGKKIETGIPPNPDIVVLRKPAVSKARAEKAEISSSRFCAGRNKENR